MNSKCVFFIVSLFFHFMVYSQSVVLIDLKGELNDPFQRKNITLSELAMQGVQEGLLAPLDSLDGMRGLDKDKFYERIKDQLSYEMTNLSLEYEQDQVKYIHFHSYYNSSGGVQYMYTLNYSDFVNYIKKYHPHLTYYTKSDLVWWKGNILLTDNYYLSHFEVFNYLVGLAQKNNEFNIYNYHTNKVVSNDTLESRNYSDPYEMFNVIIEEDKGEIDKMVFVRYVRNSSNEKFYVKWDEYVDFIQKTKKRKPIMLPLYIALRNTMFYSISGDFLGKIEEQKNFKATVYHTSYIDKSFEENSLFFNEEETLIGIIDKAIINGEIRVYENDSLINLLSYKDYLEAKTKYANDPLQGYNDYLLKFYERNKAKKKDDRVVYYGRLYELKSPLEGSDKMEDIESKLKPIFFNLELTDIFAIHYEVNFDASGQNKKYKPIGLTINISSSQDDVYLQDTPIASVKWEEVKPILKKMKNGKKWIKAIEKRKFISIFLFTSYPVVHDY